ncbi:hypothetical protein J0910_31255 [Nocardiopsis sp. CNT-189]|uniref:hypothetical protein n=1 Tax=Nocardiopsis oceanisediminis TaxID=2816862 RepID=UPI003B339EA6
MAFAAGCLPFLFIAALLGFLVISPGGGSCSPTTSVSVDGDVPKGPIGKGSWSGEQLVNAAIIMNVGADMGLSVRDQTIGVMTAMGESSLRNLDHGDAAGEALVASGQIEEGSRGLFQQLGNGAWGSHEDRTDPVRSSEMFFEQLEKVDGRDDMEPTLVAHTVQRNADAYHYAPHWADAKKVVAALSGVAAEAIPVSSEQCELAGGGGEPVISEDCAPVSDGIHPSACRAYAALTAEFGEFWDPNGGVGCQDPRDGTGDHPVGQACDYMLSTNSQTPTPQMQANAVKAIDWLIAHHEKLEVKYVMYDEHIWNPSKDPVGPWEKVKNYRGGRYSLGTYGGNKTLAHIDHIHLSTGPWHHSKGR